MKKIFLAAALIIASLFVDGVSLNAQETSETIGIKSDVSKAKDAGNKICPVSGERIDEKNKATYEYEGKIYNFCCAMCIDEFKKDPAKYIKKVEEELKKSDSETKTEQHH